MSTSGKQRANTPSESEPSEGNIVSLPQSRSRGRPKGARNKRTIDAERFVQPLTAAAKKRLKAVLEGPDDDLALKAAQLVMSYRFGKPTDRREVSGPGGGPVETRQVIEAASERVVEALGEAAGSDDVAAALGDEGLHATQAINFVTARHAVASRRAGAGSGGFPQPAPPASAASNGRADTEAISVAEGYGGPGAEADAGVSSPSGPDIEIENENPEPKIGEQAHVGGFVVECNAPSRDNLPPSYAIRTNDGQIVTQSPGGWPGALAWIRSKVGPDVDTVPRIVKPSQPLGPSRADQWATVARHRPEAHRRRS